MTHEDDVDVRQRRERGERRVRSPHLARQPVAARADADERVAARPQAERGGAPRGERHDDEDLRDVRARRRAPERAGDAGRRRHDVERGEAGDGAAAEQDALVGARQRHRQEHERHRDRRLETAEVEQRVDAGGGEHRDDAQRDADPRGEPQPARAQRRVRPTSRDDDLQRACGDDEDDAEGDERRVRAESGRPERAREDEDEDVAEQVAETHRDGQHDAAAP